MEEFSERKTGKWLCVLLCIHKHSDFLVWVYSKCPISILSYHTALCLNWEVRGGVTKCVCGTDTTSRNTNLINFLMQILDLLILCADTCSHTILPANSQGTHGGLVHRHFAKLRQISCLFCLVTIETLYSRGDSRLIFSLGMQIPPLSFAIENANTFRSKTSLKHSKMCINH